MHPVQRTYPGSVDAAFIYAVPGGGAVTALMDRSGRLAAGRPRI